MKSNSTNKINKLSVICNAPLKEKSLVVLMEEKCHALGSLMGHNSFLYTFKKNRLVGLGKPNTLWDFASIWEFN